MLSTKNRSRQLISGLTGAIQLYYNTMKGKLEEQLEEVRLAVEGALANPSIMRKLEKFGYTQKEMKAGRGLIEKVELIITHQGEGFGTQKNATRQLQEARKEVHVLYMQHLSIARVALHQQPEVWDVLKMHGKRKENMAGWLAQVKAFYNNFHRVQATLEKYNITADEVAQAQTMIEAIVSLRVQQSYGKSEKQRATEQCKEAIRDLQQWMRDFLYIARYALKDEKQQLEALGQVV